MSAGNIRGACGTTLRTNMAKGIMIAGGLGSSSAGRGIAGKTITAAGWAG